MQTDKPTDPKSIQTLMGESALGAIIRKAQILDKINHHLPDVLSKEISDSARVLNLKENCLTLASNNSAMATCIRYQEEELLKRLSKIDGIPPIHRIECVVRPG